MAETLASPVRLDKWLWAVRVFKTRSLAADACRRGHVSIDGQPAKPSREVKVNDLVVVIKGDTTRHFKVLQPLATRVGAQKVHEFADNQTPPALLEATRNLDSAPIAVRPRGSGRPTKKERRQIEQLFP
jgi:ribosome-associated heat shock protein Hsp15